MKRASFILVSLLVARFGQAKEQYSQVKSVYSQKTVDKIEKIYENKEYGLLVYGRNGSNRSNVEVLVVSCDDVVSYWCLKNDSIVSNGTIASDRIFKFGDLKMVGVRKEEEFPAGTFIPHVYNGIDMEYVVFKNQTLSFHLEFGNIISYYKPDARYEKYRREWISIVRQEVLPILRNYKELADKKGQSTNSQ